MHSGAFPDRLGLSDEALLQAENGHSGQQGERGRDEEGLIGSV